MNIISLYPKNNGDLNGLVRETQIKVKVESNGLTDLSSNPSGLFDGTEFREVCTPNQQNSYFIFSFDKYFISPTNYTISVNPSWDSNDNFPVNWKIEGAFKDEWHKIGKVEESNLKTEKIKTFLISVPANILNIFNKLRFIMIGNSSTEKYYHFCLYKMDFFGTFIHESIITSYIKNLKKINQKQALPLNLATLISIFFRVKQ